MNYLDVDDGLNTASDDLDPTFLFFVIESLELALFLPVVDGTNDHLRSINNRRKLKRNAHTTMRIATMMATPSTQSTGGSPAGLVVPKSWNKPKASETTAAIESRTWVGSNILLPPKHEEKNDHEPKLCPSKQHT